jgi:hypothetical protein
MIFRSPGAGQSGAGTERVADEGLTTEKRLFTAASPAAHRFDGCLADVLGNAGLVGSAPAANASAGDARSWTYPVTLSGPLTARRSRRPGEEASGCAQCSGVTGAGQPAAVPT